MTDPIEALADALAHIFLLDGEWRKYGERVSELLAKAGFAIAPIAPPMAVDAVHYNTEQLAGLTPAQVMQKTWDDCAPIAPADEKLREAVEKVSRARIAAVGSSVTYSVMEGAGKNAIAANEYISVCAVEMDTILPALQAALAERDTLRAASQWQPIETAPKDGKILLGVWEGDWNNPKQQFRVYEATIYKTGPSWAMKGNYRTEEGGAYKIAGWMPLPPAPEAT